MKKKIFTIIILRNISSLDFIIPLIYEIKRQHPDIQFNILFCRINKTKILRGSKYYTAFLKNMDVALYDYLDFIFVSYIIKNLIRKIFSNSERDRITKKNRFYEVVKRLKGKLEFQILNKINFSKLYKLFDTDFVFWPPRVNLGNIEKKLWDLLYKNKNSAPKIILYPHGPYYSGGFYRPPLPNGKVLSNNDTDNLDIWYPDSEDDISIHYKNKNHFFYSGYPGFDNNWLAYINKKYSYKGVDSKKIKCLFVIRKFTLNKNDDWIFDTDEFEKIAQIVCDKIIALKDIELIIKPHPYNDYTEVVRLFSKFCKIKFKISYDSIYKAIVEADFVVSVPSTTNLLPMLLEKPIVLFNCSVLQTFYKWEGMKKMYPDTLPFFAKNFDEIPKMVHEAYETVKYNKNQEILKNIKEFVRKRYPDKMSPKIIKRLEI